MEELRTQVAKARRRLNLAKFLDRLPWCLFAGLLACIVALSVGKFYPPQLDPLVWNAICLGGGLLLGFLAAVVWTMLRKASALDAAIELDYRYGLQERVSSSLALEPDERESPAGQALLADAARRVARIEVNEQFAYRPNRRALLPLVPAAIAFGLLFVGSQANESVVNATPVASLEAKQIQQSAEPLRVKLSDSKKQASEKNLPDATKLIEKLENAAKELTKKQNGDKKEALTKLNDVVKELDARREKLAADDRIKQQLNNMKDMPAGPADKVADSLKNGDFKKAGAELAKLKDLMKSDKLDEKQKAELAKQLEAMQKKIEKMTEAHDKTKKELERQIAEAKKAGNQAQMNKLQEKLDKMNDQQQARDQMAKMASKLGQAAKAAKAGKAGDAGKALQELADQMDELAKQNDELQMLDQAMDMVADCKNAMACDKCQGKGCQACQGMGKDGKTPGNKDYADGRATGAEGRRGIKKTDTKTYDSRVSQNVGKGAAVTGGTVEGPNTRGRVQEVIKSEIAAVKREEADPVTTQHLSRQQREYAQKYLDRFREGK